MTPQKSSKKKSPLKIHKAKTGIQDKWDVLRGLILCHVDAAIADSWKGGGDPEEMPILEMEVKIALMRLENHITNMRRELDNYDYQ